MNAVSTPTERSRPRRFALPDLSALDVELTRRLVMTMTFRTGFPEDDAGYLAMTFVRSVETALRSYDSAREQFEESTAKDSFWAYLRGLSAMEVAFITLHRAMRLAVSLVGSEQTSVTKQDIPSGSLRHRLQAMRAAIEHNEQAIKDGRVGSGEILALFIREHHSEIDAKGVRHQLTHSELAESLAQLHRLALKLANEPEGSKRTTRESAA